MENLNEWMLTPESTTSITGVEELIAKLAEARLRYDKAKTLSSEAFHVMEQAQKDVMNALKANGRTKFEAEGIASVQIRSKDMFTTPKTPEQKEALFAYIQSKHGNESLLGLLSIHSGTLNSWANKEIESDPTLQIPGLEAPTSVETLYFTKK